MGLTAAPTERQLRYLRSLAVRTATTFVVPGTRRQASEEIDRLIALSRQQPERSAEPGRNDESDRHYATAVHPDEVSGFGAGSSWRSRPPAKPPVPHPDAVRLLTYRVRGSERALLAERRGGRIHVTDVPARGSGRQYAVERLDCSEGAGPLRALAEDYRSRAEALKDIPMAAGGLVKTLHGLSDDG